MSLCEKYRPKNWDEIIGQDEIVESLKEREEGNLHMLFLGPAGTGKTSVAIVYATENNLPIEELNASDERGIDVIRGKIKRLSKIKGRRIILLDEADNLTGDAQQALRRTMETTKSCIFILCGNYSDKLIDPIKSRCAEYHFDRISDKQILKRLLFIAKSEGMQITSDSKDGFIELVKQCNGDLRKAINTFEAISSKDKKITKLGVIKFLKPNIASESLDLALNGDFTKAQAKLETLYVQSKVDSSVLLAEFYDAIKTVKDDKIRARLNRELAIVSRSMRAENNPLIQLVGFLSFAWICQHFSDDCPAFRSSQ